LAWQVGELDCQARWLRLPGRSWLKPYWVALAGLKTVYIAHYSATLAPKVAQ